VLPAPPGPVAPLGGAGADQVAFDVRQPAQHGSREPPGGMRPPNQARPSCIGEESATGGGSSQRSTPKSLKIELLPALNGVSSIRSIATTSPGFGAAHEQSARYRRQGMPIAKPA
jgi:hypothetical protein